MPRITSQLQSPARAHTQPRRVRSDDASDEIELQPTGRNSTNRRTANLADRASSHNSEAGSLSDTDSLAPERGPQNAMVKAIGGAAGASAGVITTVASASAYANLSSTSVSYYAGQLLQEPVAIGAIAVGTAAGALIGAGLVSHIPRRAKFAIGGGYALGLVAGAINAAVGADTEKATLGINYIVAGTTALTWVLERGAASTGQK